MMRLRDPSAMSPTERLIEVAFLFAVGYRRLILSRRNRLDLSARAEALSGVLDGRGDAPGKETAR